MKKIFYTLGLGLFAGVACADLSTGRFDSVSLSYGKTSASDIAVLSNAWAWNMPVYPSQNSAMSLQVGLMRWQDKTASDNSFVGLHMGPVLKIDLDGGASNFVPHVDLGLGAAYFGRKDFGSYHLESNFKLETSAMLGAHFGSVDQFDVAVGYTGYYLGGGDTVHVMPKLALTYLF